MPNWCEGSLKLKGKYDDILRFWQEGVNAYSYSADRNNERGIDLIPKEEWYDFDKGENYLRIENEIPPAAWIYIEGTKRAFIDSSFCGFDIFKLPNDQVILVLPFKQAWSIVQTDWIDIATKYGLEIKIYAIEAGTGFWCTFHVLRDGAIIDNNFHQPEGYEDFVWNCPFPWMGG